MTFHLKSEKSPKLKPNINFFVIFFLVLKTLVRNERKSPIISAADITYYGDEGLQ